MKRFFLLGIFALSAMSADWKIAEPGWQYSFPRDHHIHPDFKTEWWYFTGNLADADGHQFGYELTFFREGIRPPAERDPNASRFIVNDLKFAHFAVTDISRQRFHFEQKFSRGAFGEAGFDRGPMLAWIENWTLSMNDDGAFDLAASSDGRTMHLHLRPTKPPVIHGTDGISAKASGEGHASHYYSLTRLETTGEFIANGKSQPIHGESWFDHEWATNQLAPNQTGWDWLSVQFDDGRELMLYRMRLTNGSVDPTSSGTLIAPDGSSVHLANENFQMTPTDYWKSPKTGANYPIGWRVDLPEHDLRFTVRAAVKGQELAFPPLIYWEGAIEVNGSNANKAITGRGYLELTGYSGPLRELQR
ncbi:MAG: carotenoid 1,2-hydratase [Verrucomicrobiota bacterium]|nr:carotenoid 1,2-hydratase [Verrucomicrobiota bacterium]